VLVFQASDVETLEMRGFALPDQVAPAIMVNGKDARSARLFTLLHEFAHILLGKEGISNLNLPVSEQSNEDRIELLCNAVAAEVLAPATVLMQVLNEGNFEEDARVEIKRLAGAFRVSRHVIARKLFGMGKLSFGEMTTFCREYDEEYRREKTSKQDDEFRVPYPRIVVRNNGKAFTQSVLDAYITERLSARDASHLLNAKVRFFRDLRTEAYS